MAGLGGERSAVELTVEGTERARMCSNWTLDDTVTELECVCVGGGVGNSTGRWCAEAGQLGLLTL